MRVALKNQGRVLTPDIKVVIKLPMRLKNAEIATRISAQVAANAIMYATNIHLEAFSYAFRPSLSVPGRRASAPVPLSPQTVTGSNQNILFA